MSPYRDWICEYTDSNLYIPYLVHKQKFTNQSNALIKDICNMKACERYNIVPTLECEYCTLIREVFKKLQQKIPFMPSWKVLIDIISSPLLNL